MSPGFTTAAWPRVAHAAAGDSPAAASLPPFFTQSSAATAVPAGPASTSSSPSKERMFTHEATLRRRRQPGEAREERIAAFLPAWHAGSD